MNFKDLIKKVEKLKNEKNKITKYYTKCLKRSDINRTMNGISLNFDLTRIDNKIEGIKQTLEAVEQEFGYMDISHPFLFNKDWQKLKELLQIK